MAAATAAASAIAVRTMRVIALRRQLLDIPNERSSHKLPVPRLGGAAFVPIVLVAAAIGSPAGTLPLGLRLAVLAGATALYATSLIDDFVTLSARLRFLVQFVVAALVLGCVMRAEAGTPLGGMSHLLVSSPWYWLLVFWVVGVLNIYNFMDGIDGIAGVQAVAAGAAWGCFAISVGAHHAAGLGFAIAAGALGFLTLNWPPAKIFMGDAGSTVIGYSFAVLPVLVWAEAAPAIGFLRLLAIGVLVVWPFLGDGIFTIFRRLRNRENILQAHRSHLYQRLVIAGKTHRQVTLTYAALALVGAILGWWVTKGDFYALLGSAGTVAALFFGLWRWTVACERSVSPQDS